MEKLNVNHEENSVFKAFIGEDKYWRLEEKLMTIVCGEGTVSERVTNAVEKYADTTEDAIGIAMLVYQNAIDRRKLRNEIDDEKIDHIKSMIDALTHKGIEGAAESIAHLLDHNSLKAYMESVDCNTCHADEKCPIQDIAKKRGIG